MRGSGDEGSQTDEDSGRAPGGTHHFHVFPREVLDFLLHPLDAVQQILILLVHALVLLHEGLQLDLRLPGAFQLWVEGDGRPRGCPITGAGESPPGPPSGLELPP